MRFVLLAILLAFPVADVYVTASIARWSGIPLWLWLGCSFVAGLVLLRNERIAFRTRTVAALHGEQSLLRGLLDSGRKVLALVPSHHNHALGEKIGIRLDVDHVVVFRNA